MKHTHQRLDASIDFTLLLMSCLQMLGSSIKLEPQAATKGRDSHSALWKQIINDYLRYTQLQNRPVSGASVRVSTFKVGGAKLE